jgi:hypothetical protein
MIAGLMGSCGSRLAANIKRKYLSWEKKSQPKKPKYGLAGLHSWLLFG